MILLATQVLPEPARVQGTAVGHGALCQHMSWMQNMAGPQAQSRRQPHKLLLCMSEPQHTCTYVQGRLHCCTQRSVRLVKGQESLFQGAGSFDPPSALQASPW